MIKNREALRRALYANPNGAEPGAWRAANWFAGGFDRVREILLGHGVTGDNVEELADLRPLGGIRFDPDDLVNFCRRILAGEAPAHSFPGGEPHSRGRSVYLSDALWAEAETRARRDARSIAYVISAALRAYLKQ